MPLITLYSKMNQAHLNNTVDGIAHPYSWQVWDFFDTSELSILDFGSQVPRLWPVNRVSAQPPRDGLVFILPTHFSDNNGSSCVLT